MLPEMQPDPTLFEERLKRERCFEKVLIIFSLFSILLVLYVPVKILSTLDDRMDDLEM